MTESKDDLDDGRRMCHRQLRFVKHTGCGHNTFLGSSTIDCHSASCINSADHPPNCNSPSKPCACRRYYEQPERFITHQAAGMCSKCPQ